MDRGIGDICRRILYYGVYADFRILNMKMDSGCVYRVLQLCFEIVGRKIEVKENWARVFRIGVGRGEVPSLKILKNHRERERERSFGEFEADQFTWKRI